MATTQYVGARYVPLFAEPAQWDINKQYEPLTIVLDHGNSYTSRQFVPAGIELTNDAFWALTGNYNAQVEQYRQEVRTYDDRITTAQTTADGAANAAAEADTKATNAKAAIDAEVTRATAKEAEIQSLASTNETDIAHLDAQMAATTGSELLNRITNNKSDSDTKFADADDKFAGTTDSGLKTLITSETQRATAAESDLASKIAEADRSSLTLNNANIVLFGDSYLLGTHANGSNTDGNGWGYYFKKEVPTATVTEFANGGAGFNSAGTTGDMAGMNASQMFTYAKGKIAEPSKVTHVMIQFGYNDASLTNIDTVVNALNNCKSCFPNAKVNLAFTYLGKRDNMNTPKNFSNTNVCYVNAAAQCGVGISSIINPIYLYQNNTYDDIHPNASVQQLLGKMMVTACANTHVQDVSLNYVENFSLSSEHVCTIDGRAIVVGSTLPSAVDGYTPFQISFGKTRYFGGVNPSGDRTNWSACMLELTASGNVNVIGGNCTNTTVYSFPFSFIYL